MELKWQMFKRKRNELGKQVRKAYEAKQVKMRLKDLRDWVPVDQPVSNTLTGVELDNLLVQTGKIMKTKLNPKSQQWNVMYDPQGLMASLQTGNGSAIPLVGKVKTIGNYGKSRFGQARQVYDKTGLSPTLPAAMGMGGGFVPTVTSGTDTQTPSTEPISDPATTATSEQLTLINSPTLISSVADSLAKVSQWLESEEDSKIHEALFSLKSLESQGLNDLVIYSLRTSKDSSVMIRAIPLRQSSQQLMSWGMTVNGKCLTARISAFRRTGSESSLSDILEEHPDQKYFLSPAVTQKLLSGQLRKVSDKQGRQEVLTLMKFTKPVK